MNGDKMFIKDHTDSNESATYTLPIAFYFRNKKGFTLFELIIVVTILSILTFTAIPLVKLSVKRQKEQQLRENLREIREAIKEFHRDTIGSPCSQQFSQGDNAGVSNPDGGGATRNPNFASVADPRTRVAICDPKMFTVDNPDKYPPTLETLVEGVNVIPRGADARVTGGAGLDGKKSLLEQQDDATEKKIKVYLRKIPVDPMTGKEDWVFRSCYQDKDATDWDGINIFDVRSSSKETALNGEKYSDW